MYKHLKRILDILILIIFFPIFFLFIILLSLLIFIIEGRPIFILQTRVGKHNKSFRLVKFRTLKKTAPSYLPTNQIDVKAHSTKFGQYLRKTGLDELPQIINILTGEMSFIGPRPLLLNQFELIELRSVFKISTLNPGITGLAQINSSADKNDKLKIDLDKKYLEEFSFYKDLIILLFTFKRIIFRMFGK